MSKVIFLDFDGPVIPARSWIYNINQEHRGMLYKYFDPIAVAMVKDALAVGKADLVISSSWRRLAYDKVVGILEDNKIPECYLHDDWATPYFSTLSPTRRADEIQGWLDNHPEVEHYAALDDEDISSLSGAVQVSMEDGILRRHHGKMIALLIGHEVRRWDCHDWRDNDEHDWMKCQACIPLFNRWEGVCADG